MHVMWGSNPIDKKLNQSLCDQQTLTLNPNSQPYPETSVSSHLASTLTPAPNLSTNKTSAEENGDDERICDDEAFLQYR